MLAKEFRSEFVQRATRLLIHNESERVVSDADPFTGQ